MNPQHMADILAIQQLLADYVYALDAKDYGALDRVFVPEAQVDYSAMGGEKGSWSQIKPWLAAALSSFPITQHVIGLPQIRLDGDRATAKTMLINPMTLRREGRSDCLFFCGCTYADELVRTSDGWRIAARREQDGWFKDAPTDYRAPKLAPSDDSR